MVRNQGNLTCEERLEGLGLLNLKKEDWAVVVVFMQVFHAAAGEGNKLLCISASRWGENREWETQDVNFLRVTVVKNCLVKNCETMMFLICQHCWFFISALLILIRDSKRKLQGQSERLKFKSEFQDYAMCTRQGMNFVSNWRYLLSQCWWGNILKILNVVWHFGMFQNNEFLLKLYYPHPL